MYFLTNLLFFDISLFYCHIYFRSPKIFCLSFGDIYLPLGISLSCSFVTVSELFCGTPPEAFLVLLAILLPIKSPVASTVF